MLRIDAELVKEFSKRYDETEKKCAEIIQMFNEFQNDVSVVQNLIIGKMNLETAKNSLLYFRFLQATIDFLDLPILLVAGSYKSVIQIVRYHFESLVQAFYLDRKHPNLNLDNKISILTEIFDKQDYFVSRLIERVKVGAKGSLKTFYKELNQIVHPSYTDFPNVDDMLKKITRSESRVRPEEFDETLEILTKMYDVSLYLIFQEFPDLKEIAKKDDSVIKTVESLSLPLLKTVFH